LAIIKISEIIEKYEIKYFKITKTEIYYKKCGVKYFITEFLNNQNRIKKSDAESYEVELNFTDDEREQNKEMEIENNVSRKRKQRSKILLDARKYIKQRSEEFTPE
jgi:single-stranded DNA-specific DHH superfamily exonuclease